MRMLMLVKMPNEEFNDAVAEGKAGKKLDKILADAKPEAVYFSEFDGQRAVVMIVDLADASEVPKFAEPWFLEFNAEVEFHVAMVPEDFTRAGIEKLGKKWA